MTCQPHHRTEKGVRATRECRNTSSEWGVVGEINAAMTAHGDNHPPEDNEALRDATTEPTAPMAAASRTDRGAIAHLDMTDPTAIRIGRGLATSFARLRATSLSALATTAPASHPQAQQTIAPVAAGAKIEDEVDEAEDEAADGNLCIPLSARCCPTRCTTSPRNA